MAGSTPGMARVRIATIRKTDRHTAEVEIAVESLDPDGDIVGRSAGAVRDIVRADATLAGGEPHLANAIGGLFACVAHQSARPGARGASTRINWNHTHDLEIEIEGRDA